MTDEIQPNTEPGDADELLDAQGLHCPEPLMLVRNTMRGLASGQILHIKATDPTTQRDLEQFCRFMGHDLLAMESSAPAAADGDGAILFEFWIRKGG